MKNLSRFLFFSLVISLLSACGGGGSASDGDGKLKIAMVPKGTTHSFWKMVHGGAAKAAQEEDIDLIWQGPQKEDDRQMQIQTMQNFISRGVDAILLAPLDDQALVPSVDAAIKRNIPVIVFDSDLKSDLQSSFVATDNYLGGKLCAQRMVEVMGGKGKAIMLRYAEGSASTTNREQGFLDGLKEYGPEIELISSNQYAGATMEKGFQASQNLLNRFGEEVQAIFTPNESATMGMLRALQTAGKAGKVKFIGFDSNETLVAALGAGEIHGLALQNPFHMGYAAVKTAVALLKDQPFDKRVDTGVHMVTAENMNEPAMQEILNPELAKWLGEE